MIKKPKVMVTGGSGFIGSHVVEALRTQGYTVEVVRSSETDICDTESLIKKFSQALYVFHLAALPRVQYSIEHPQKTHEVNVGGTLSVLQAAKEAGVRRVIFASSSAVYGNQDKMPLQEDMRAQPKNPYALQKYIGELYCKLYSELYGLETVVLRYFNVYGPRADSEEGSNPTVIARFLKLRGEGGPLPLVGGGTQTLDFVHVADVARANVLAAQSTAVGRGEVINISSGHSVSINYLAELIGGPTEFIGSRLEPHSTLADITRAKKLLGWEPQIILEEGIAELKKSLGLI